MTRQAEQAGCSRETVYQHARKVESRLAAEPDADAVAELREENQRLREEIAGLRRGAEGLVRCDKAAQRRLATTAFAMGVSLRQVEDLLGVLLPAAEVPDHSTLGHWVRDRGPPRRRGPGGPRPGVRPSGADARPRRDLFWGRPTLVGIEPASMTAVFCRNAADRKAETWKKELDPFSRLEFAVSDAAKGIAAAVEQVAAGRHGAAEAETGPTLEHGLDVFHTAMEAHRVLARHWRHAEAAWDEAEAADVRVARARDSRASMRGARRARPAPPGEEATAALERVEHLEGAWRRAHAALEVFRPDGRLNDRATAEAEIAAALPGLPGADWAKVRNFLRDPRSLAFLDRMHRRLESAEPRRAWREAMAWRWWLRHRRPTPSDPMTALVQAVGRERPLTEAEQARRTTGSRRCWGTRSGPAARSSA